MQLKSLELTGFKSFPEKTLINFSEGITAIIGPNGSGKSNISDAIRWVMGETSTKSLRGTKMEDVIFDGTQSRKALGFAEVTLTLDNSDKLLPIDFDEVAISRRYYRSGDSEYYINKSQVRMRDVHDLLRDTGLGKSGYSIIGQGSATEIINAKSSDRRYLFEEASGIAKFRYKKEESERRLNLTNDNLIRLNDIKTEIEDRLGPLETQAKKAKRYLELYDKKKDLEIAVWLDDIKLTEAESVKAEETLASLKRSVEKCENELIDCESRIEKETENIRLITVEIENIRNENSEVSEKIRALNSEILLLGNDTEHANKDIERFEEQKNSLLGQREETAKLLAEKLSDIERITAGIVENDKEQATVVASSRERMKQEEASTEKAKALHDELTSVMAKITELQIEVGRLEEQLSSSEERKKQLEDEISDGEERLTSLNIARAEYLKELNKLKEERQNLGNIYDGYVLKISSKRTQAEKATERYNELKRIYDEKTSRKRMLEDLAKHYEGFNGSVRNVMNDASKGILKGVIGTVASVIKTEDQYTVAIETALGSAIQNIITENEKSAKDCIYYLKSRNYGRATFLPVDTVSGSRLQNNGAASCEGYVGIASDLLEYEPKFKGIIEQLLGRIVIADTIDNATQMARRNKYSFRIVTLDGQVVNPGGSLTGGSVSKGIGILSRSNEVDALTEEISTVEEKLKVAAETAKNVTNDFKSVSASLEGLNAEIKIADEALIKKEAELKNGDGYIGNVTAQIESLKKVFSSETEKQYNLKSSMEKATASLEEFKKKAEITESESDEISKLSAELSAEKEKVIEKLHQIELVKTELIKNKEIAQNEAENLRRTIKETEEAGSLSQKQIDELKIKIDEYAKRIEEASAQIVELENQNESRTKLIAQKNIAREECEARKNKGYENERRIFEQKDKLGRELERTSIKCGTLKNEKDSLVSKIWDEYELSVSDAESLGLKFENKDEAKAQITSLKNSIRGLGSVNVDAIEEFAEVSKRYEELSTQLADLETAKASLEKIILDLEAEMTQIFSEKFKTINAAFEEVFKELFNGGTAKLTLTDPENVLESGVEIFVAPPGKIIKHLSSLSGGEQSLTAIALYFALLKIRPAPFCLLDEIESALDDVNVVRYANYLRTLTKKTQFLVITHRRGTMETADRLYGVTMREKGVSRIITINVSEIENNMLG